MTSFMLMALAVMTVAAENLGTASIDSESLFLGFSIFLSSALICAQIKLSSKGD